MGLRIKQQQICCVQYSMLQSGYKDRVFNIRSTAAPSHSSPNWLVEPTNSVYAGHQANTATNPQWHHAWDFSLTYGVPHDDIIFNDVHWPEQWPLIVHNIVTIVKLDFKQASKSCMQIANHAKTCIAFPEKMLASSDKILLVVNWCSPFTITKGFRARVTSSQCFSCCFYHFNHLQGGKLQHLSTACRTY